MQSKLSFMAQKYKVAIVEDDLLICNMYKIKLENADFIVRTANNGLEGYNLIRDFGPDIILLDLKMPEMTGEEMLAKIRSTEWGSRPRVIILTNISKDEAPLGLRFLNVNRYIVKAHHTPSQVIAIVQEVLA